MSPMEEARHAAPSLGSAAGWLDRGRSLRMKIAVAAIILMSLVDLELTLIYSMSVGMLEKNPIARMIMQTGSPELLVAWKVGTVGLAAVIFWCTRRHRASEAAAWLCVLVLGALMTHWINFNEQAAEVSGFYSSLASVDPGRWVQLSE